MDDDLLVSVEALRNKSFPSLKRAEKMFMDCTALSDITPLYTSIALNKLKQTEDLFAGCVALKNSNIPDPPKTWYLGTSIQQVVGEYIELLGNKGLDESIVMKKRGI